MASAYDKFTWSDPSTCGHNAIMLHNWPWCQAREPTAETEVFEEGTSHEPNYPDGMPNGENLVEAEKTGRWPAMPMPPARCASDHTRTRAHAHAHMHAGSRL